MNAENVTETHAQTPPCHDENGLMMNHKFKLLHYWLVPGGSLCAACESQFL